MNLYFKRVVNASCQSCNVKTFLELETFWPIQLKCLNGSLLLKLLHWISINVLWIKFFLLHQNATEYYKSSHVLGYEEIITFVQQGCIEIIKSGQNLIKKKYIYIYLRDAILSPFSEIPSFEFKMGHLCECILNVISCHFHQSLFSTRRLTIYFMSPS